MVYCFYEGSQAKIKVKSIDAVDTDRDGETTRRAIFGQRRQFKNVPPMLGLHAIIEVRTAIRHPSVTT